MVEGIPPRYLDWDCMPLFNIMSLDMPWRGYSPCKSVFPIGVPLIPVWLIGICLEEMKSSKRLRASSFSTKFSRTFLLSAPLKSSFEMILLSLTFAILSCCFYDFTLSTQFLKVFTNLLLCFVCLYFSLIWFLICSFFLFLICWLAIFYFSSWI